MSRLHHKLPAPIVAALEATGLPWSVEVGGRGHGKILLAGRLVGVASVKRKDDGQRSVHNVVGQIRRMAAALACEKVTAGR